MEVVKGGAERLVSTKGREGWMENYGILNAKVFRAEEEARVGFVRVWVRRRGMFLPSARKRPEFGGGLEFGGGQSKNC